MPRPTPVVDEGAARVGPAVLDHLAHSLEKERIDPLIQRELASYPAHETDKAIEAKRSPQHPVVRSDEGAASALNS